jgi:hypothetical protein
MQFRKKPVVIDATQWHKNGDHPAVRPIAPSDDLYFTGIGGATLSDREKYGVIGTLESPNHLVSPGDWIITGVQGEHYPASPTSLRPPTSRSNRWPPQLRLATSPSASSDYRQRPGCGHRRGES